jgi:hypothetical protein
VRRFHNARWDDPLLYHLVINTALVPVPVAVECIAAALAAGAASSGLAAVSKGELGQ